MSISTVEQQLQEAMGLNEKLLKLVEELTDGNNKLLAMNDGLLKTQVELEQQIYDLEARIVTGAKPGTSCPAKILN